MSDCDARLFDGPLVCTRPDPHDTGHIYVPSTAIEADEADDE